MFAKANVSAALIAQCKVLPLRVNTKEYSFFIVVTHRRGNTVVTMWTPERKGVVYMN